MENYSLIQPTYEFQVKFWSCYEKIVHLTDPMQLSAYNDNRNTQNELITSFFCENKQKKMTEIMHLVTQIQF